MKWPYAIQGLLFAPAFIGLVFLLKAFCPGSAGDSCFADFFAVPVFLPLITMYKIFGQVPGANGQEFLFLILYWSLVGFLVGFILDLYIRRSQYSPEQRPPL
jgi:hypothetical protein